MRTFAKMLHQAHLLKFSWISYFKITNQHPIWLIVRSTKPLQQLAKLRLRQGSVIKISHLSFQVKRQTIHDTLMEPVFTVRANDPIFTCRIFIIEDSSNDQLISICKCLGSIQHAHVNCLQSWILSKPSPWRRPCFQVLEIYLLWIVQNYDTLQANNRRSLLWYDKAIHAKSAFPCSLRNPKPAGWA